MPFFIIPPTIPINNIEGIIMEVSPVNREQAKIIKMIKAILFPLMIFLMLILSFIPKKSKMYM